MHDRSGEGHEQGRIEALAGHVGDHDGEGAAAPLEAEQLEEVAADVTRRGVVAGQLVARDVRGDERKDAALLAPSLGELRRVDTERLGRGPSPIIVERQLRGGAQPPLDDELLDRDGQRRHDVGRPRTRRVGAARHHARDEVAGDHDVRLDPLVGVRGVAGGGPAPR